MSVRQSSFKKFKGNWKDYYICKLPVVYCITNIINGNLYIGISSNISKRLRDYGAILKSNKKYSNIQVIGRALKKYGADNFSFDIIKIYDNIEECKCEEIEQIAYFRSINYTIYNSTDGGDHISNNQRAGEEVYNAKLKNNDILRIFKLHHIYNKFPKEISKIYKVDENVIYRVLKGDTYKNISHSLISRYGIKKNDTSMKCFGHLNYQSKFDEHQIENLFKLYHIDYLSTEDLAKIYNTCRGTIHKILTGKSYKNVSIKFKQIYGNLRISTWKIHNKEN